MPTGLEILMSGYGNRCFPMPAIAGRYTGQSLVVCADGHCIWSDLAAFGCASRLGRGGVRKDGWDLMTINKTVENLPGIVEHAYSNSPPLLAHFIAARRDEYAGEFEAGPRQVHSCNTGAQWVWPWGGHGTSGLGAVLVGLGLGYDRIALAGMPLDDGPHNGEPPWRRCAFASREAAGPAGGGPDAHWKRARDEAFEGRVRSLSGRTLEWLGDARSWT